MSISKEKLREKIKCFYKKKDDSYSFVLNDAMAINIKLQDKDCTFSVSTEKKLISKSKTGKEIPLDTAVKKTFDKAMEFNSSPDPKLAGAVYLFMDVVSKAVKERKAMFEWAEFIDPFLSEEKPDELPQPVFNVRNFPVKN